jgi:hypothetical protein
MRNTLNSPRQSTELGSNVKLFPLQLLGSDSLTGLNLVTVAVIPIVSFRCSKETGWMELLLTPWRYRHDRTRLPNPGRLGLCKRPEGSSRFRNRSKHRIISIQDICDRRMMETRLTSGIFVPSLRVRVPKGILSLLSEMLCEECFRR